MLTVACVYKSEPNGPYSPEDVVRLARGVHKHLSIPHRMVCLTDDVQALCGVDGGYPKVQCAIESLQHGWRGWWAKMELFALEGPVLYLDLDTVIIGSLDEIAYKVSESDRLVMLRGFYRGDRCSGVMGWGDGVSTRWILDTFISDIRTPPAYVQTPLALRMTCKRMTHRGDQEWLDWHLKQTQTPTVFLQDIASGVCSYKVDVRDKGGVLPTDARVVCFHGQPRPRDVAEHEPWMAEWMGVAHA